MIRARPPKIRPDEWLQDHPDRLLKPRHAALFLDFDVQSLADLRCKGEGPPYLVMENGYSIRYRLGDLKRWAGMGVKA